jgi:hypothetical protein
LKECMLRRMADGLKKGANGAGHGGAARGYSWPPFREGNEISLRHGARSDRFLSPQAQAFYDVLARDHRDLTEAYPELCAAYCWAEARVELLRVSGRFLKEDGSVRNAHDILRFESQAQRFREALGLTPLSDAQLAKVRAEAVLTTVDLDGIRQRGREALARRQQAELAAATVDVEVVQESDV